MHITNTTRSVHDRAKEPGETTTRLHLKENVLALFAQKPAALENKFLNYVKSKEATHIKATNLE